MTAESRLMSGFCSSCGTPVMTDAIFCHRCGRNFTVEMAAVQMPHDEPGAIALAAIRAALADRYAIARELGRGGMATVYLAKDVKHEREVAIKVLHPELAASLGADRFEREIRLAAKLQHPHILGLFDSGSADGLLYYVMPFVKGESLRDRLDRDGMLPVEDAIGFALEVADALGYAHTQGVVHRDIKPENILLSAGHALVADFGIARAFSEGGGARKLTQTGMSMGTPFYMAPEQAAGDAVGPTADIYSLGCMLYEMLAGEPPFTGQNALQIMARHAMEQVPSIRIVRSAVPEEIEMAIFAALGKMPADRPQTAAQFAEFMGMPAGSTSTMRVAGLTPTGSRRINSLSRAMPAITAPEPEPPPAVVPWWRGSRAMVAAALVVAALGFGAWRMRGAAAHAAAVGPDARRIAVLYFKDVSSDSSLVPLADGLTEGLIRALGKAPSLTVISQAGVAPFRASGVATDSIARALRAGYLVRGEVEPEGDKVKVSVMLDDASGVNLKRASFVRPAGNMIAMRDSLVLLASNLIKRQLGEEIQVRESAGTSDPNAWLLVQRGRQAQKNAEALAAKGDSAGNDRAFRSADSLYAAAASVDAKWSEPVTLRAALAYRRSRLAGRDAAKIRPWVTLGLEYANAALLVNPDDADALETRGNLVYWSWFSNLETDAAKKDAQLLAAQADLEKATRLNPRQAGAWSSLASLYYQLPKQTTADAYLAAQHAYDADEFASNANQTLNRLFLASYDLGSFDKAEQFCGEFHARFPTDVRSLRCGLYLLSNPKSGSFDIAKAWQTADSLVAHTPPATQPLERLTDNMLVAAVIARASKTRPELADSARHVAKASEGNAQIDGTRESAYRGAYTYTILGDKANAIRLLTDYLAANPQRAVTLRDDPGWWFRDISSERQFRQLVGAAR
jgi:eukaryotic-like serine/threonine-protein kinase